MPLFKTQLTDNQNLALYYIYTNPYATLSELYAMSGVTEYRLRVAINTSAKLASSRNTRLHLFNVAGYINVPHPDVLGIPMKAAHRRILATLSQHPDVTNPELARLANYSTENIRLQLRNMRMLTSDIYGTTSAVGRSADITKLLWYEHMGWFAREQMAQDAETQYNQYITGDIRN
jgi:DNA-binding MarR family transcriptional regulator